MKRQDFIHKKAECYTMTDEEFVIWLNGFFEITNATEVGPEQTKIIKEKLQSLFVKETGKKQETVQPNGSLVLNPNSTIFGGSSTATPNYMLRNTTTGGVGSYGADVNFTTPFVGIPPLNSSAAATVGPTMVLHTC